MSNATVQDLYDVLKPIVDNGDGQFQLEGIEPFNFWDVVRNAGNASIALPIKTSYSKGWNDCLAETRGGLPGEK